MRKFSVLITEHLQGYVYIDAESAEEAIVKAREIWNDGVVSLNADNFTGVEFSAVEDGRIAMLLRDRNGNEHMEGRAIK